MAVAHPQAARAMAAGDVDGARAALSGRDDPLSLSLRVEIAEGEDKLPEAISLQEH